MSTYVQHCEVCDVHYDPYQDEHFILEEYDESSFPSTYSFPFINEAEPVAKTCSKGTRLDLTTVAPLTSDELAYVHKSLGLR